MDVDFHLAFDFFITSIMARIHFNADMFLQCECIMEKDRESVGRKRGGESQCLLISLVFD